MRVLWLVGAWVVASVPAAIAVGGGLHRFGPDRDGVPVAGGVAPPATPAPRGS